MKLKLISLLSAVLLFPAATFADISISFATVNGEPSTTILPGDTLEIEIEVSRVAEFLFTDRNDWEDTSWNIIPDGVLSDTCAGTPEPDYTSGGFPSTSLSMGSFTIAGGNTADLEDGVYDLLLSVYRDDPCFNERDSTTLSFTVVTPEPDDEDADGVPDETDNCPSTSNSGQENTDGDGTGDACDETPNGDTDEDGVDNDADNCPEVANTEQTDTDDDGDGDACDDTPDGDGDEGGGGSDESDSHGSVTSGGYNYCDKLTPGLFMPIAHCIDRITGLTTVGEYLSSDGPLKALYIELLGLLQLYLQLLAK